MLLKVVTTLDIKTDIKKKINNMALSDCPECWQTPCECGYEFKRASKEYKEKMTKSVNGYSIKEIFQWLSNKNYLNEDWETIYNEFIKNK